MNFRNRNSVLNNLVNFVIIRYFSEDASYVVDLVYNKSFENVFTNLFLRSHINTFKVESLNTKCLKVRNVN